MIYESNATTTTYKWMVEKQIYHAQYHNEQQRLLKIDIQFDPQPTLGDLERCFGKPSYYKANFYTHNYEWLILNLVSKPTYSTWFTLYYPDQGLHFLIIAMVMGMKNRRLPLTLRCGQALSCGQAT